MIITEHSITLMYQLLNRTARLYAMVLEIHLFPLNCSKSEIYVNRRINYGQIANVYIWVK